MSEKKSISDYIFAIPSFEQMEKLEIGDENPDSQTAYLVISTKELWEKEHRWDDEESFYDYVDEVYPPLSQTQECVYECDKEDLEAVKQALLDMGLTQVQALVEME